MAPSPSSYRDFAAVNETDVGRLGQAREECFPSVLHYMLTAMAKDGADVVAWRPHGRAFCVNDTAALEKKALKLWFRQSKYSSFQRQLNIYGFRCITSGPDRGSYYHEMFLRDRPFLAAYITRQLSRKERGVTGVQGEPPNLYLLPTVTSTPDQQSRRRLVVAASEHQRQQQEQQQTTTPPRRPVTFLSQQAPPQTPTKAWLGNKQVDFHVAPRLSLHNLFPQVQHQQRPTVWPQDRHLNQLLTSSASAAFGPAAAQWMNASAAPPPPPRATAAQEQAQLERVVAQRRQWLQQQQPQQPMSARDILASALLLTRDF